MKKNDCGEHTNAVILACQGKEQPQATYPTDLPDNPQHDNLRRHAKTDRKNAGADAGGDEHVMAAHKDVARAYFGPKSDGSMGANQRNLHLPALSMSRQQAWHVLRKPAEKCQVCESVGRINR